MAHDPSRGDPRSPRHARGFANRVAEEIRKFAVIAVYLWLLFGLFALHEMLIRRRMGLAYQAEGFAIINALVLGKVMLIAENFNFGGGRANRPLIYCQRLRE